MGRTRPFSSARTSTTVSASPTRATPDFVLDVTARFQTIDGFGASSADLSDHTIKTMSATQADLFFTTSAGIGLTYLRLPLYIDFVDALPFNTDVGDLYNQAQLAGDRGAKLVASFWSAPAAYKTNGTTGNGGDLLSAHDSDWASIMASFQAALHTATGYNLYAMGVQNEPDFTASYASMRYTPAQMTRFVKVLGPALAALSPVPLLMLGEPATWSNLGSYISDTMSDNVAAPYVGLFAAHQYGGVAAPSSNALRIWQTEMSGVGDTYDPTMTDALVRAQQIHDALVTGNVTAWFWWWLFGQSTDNEGLIGSSADVPGPPTNTKRLFALGNFSKFVRPGYVRVGLAGTVAGVSATGYYDTLSRHVVLVAINTNAFAVPLTVQHLGVNLTALTPNVTDATHDLAALSTFPVVNGFAQTLLAPLSVTSLTGTGT